MSEIELVSCPFCSGKVEIRQKGYGIYYGGCVNGCFISSSEYDKNVLAKQLNTRKPLQDIVERLKDDIEENPEASLGNYRAGLYKAIDIVKEVGGMNG